MATSSRGNRWIALGVGGVVGIGLIFGFVAVVRSLMQTGEARKDVVHNISLIKQPPPPPPKPPEKPPEPPKMRDEVKVQTPDQKPEDKPADAKPPSDQPLGVDAKGGPGSDPYGLAGRIGGNDLLSTGGGGAYYTGLLQRQLYEALMRSKQVQRHDFKVVVKVTLSGDGRIAAVDVISGSGDKDLDHAILQALADVPPLKDVPPASLRQVEVRLTNRV